MTTEIEVKSAYKLKMEARNRRLYDEYNVLMAKKGAVQKAVYETLCKRYGFFSPQTIWRIVKDEAARRRQ